MVTAANFSLTGWGTGAAISSFSGTQKHFSVVIKAGASPAINPKVTFFFTDDFPTPPVCLAEQIETAGSGAISDLTVVTATFAMALIYLGIPMAGKLYAFIVDTLGV